jgi:hypothetical protein
MKGREYLPFLDMDNSSKIITLCIFTHGEDHDGDIGKTQLNFRICAWKLKQFYTSWL